MKLFFPKDQTGSSVFFRFDGDPIVLNAMEIQAGKEQQVVYEIVFTSGGTCRICRGRTGGSGCDHCVGEGL